MITRLRSLWDSVNASYWFYPGLLALTAFGLALLTIWIDRTEQLTWLKSIGFVDAPRPEGARSMLTVIAGSMIGVASTVFSITIAAVAYASGNFGPRLLTNFMEDKGNQLSLGTFIATFVYALTVLRTVRDEEEVATVVAGGDPLPGFVPQVSLLVAYALMGVAVMVLVYFLNHIPASIRVNTVLQGIGDRLIRDIKHNFDQPCRGQVGAVEPTGKPVLTDKVGYIQIINFKELNAVADKANGFFGLAVRTGDFVHPDMPLGYWQGDGGDSEPPAASIRSCFALGGRRTPSQDLHFLIDELVEIGLRALSPGINDPFTAISALHWLGAATAELGPRDLAHSSGDAGQPNTDRVSPLNNDFSHYVQRGFGSIRSGVATSPIAAVVMFDALRHATSTFSNAERHRVLVNEGEQLMRQARLVLDGPDLKQVEARYHSFMRDMAADR
ncbi:DUF2254 domain-containing protein [Porphyrobacter sp. GA68]|uniref:DUF2254 domain-containing protein n=1 Tax=Porphyrobacter sp. GA68 TaxID=2883480 RepID=UPI001D192E15|nr:DUF2254 domain-containing protein [Porphyrobacter sp. GA68]